MNHHHHLPWSDIIIERKVEWEDGPEEGAVLLIPRFRRGPLARWLQPRLRRPYIRVKLDALGSFVWRLCDGKTTFGTIVSAMCEKFGDAAKHAEDRLKKFLTILRNHKFVELLKPAP